MSSCWVLVSMIVLGGFVVAAAACGEKQEAPAPAPTETEPAATKAEAEPAPKTGGYLKLPSVEPRYLNPVLQVSVDKANMLIFEGLVGRNERLDPIPRLAESWERTPDGTTITFKLRQGVKWHDGEPFTSADVAFTFQAIQDSEARSLWRAYMSAVESLETPDEHTVVVKYRYPYAPALSSWSVGILPAHLFQADAGPDVADNADGADKADGAGKANLVDATANREPVGTGPYKVERWELGKRLILQANPDWWYGRPHIDTIELLFDVPENTESLAAGQIDLANIQDTEDWMNRAQSVEFRQRFEVADFIESRIQLIAWNLQRAPYEQSTVRKALTLALDRGRVVQDVLLGLAQPLSAPFFANMFGADPSVAPHAFDLDRAALLLDNAGLRKKGDERFTISMIAPESQRSPTTDEVIAVFRSDLGAIGVVLEFDYLPLREFLQRLGKRDFDAAYFTWLPDISDPDPYALLHSSMIGLGANFAGYANPEVDGLLDRARAKTDRNERKAMYQQVHRLVYEDLPYTTLFAPFGHYAWNRRVRGVSPGDVSSQPRFPGVARWWIGEVPAAAALPGAKN